MKLVVLKHQKEYESKNVKELFKSFYKSTGVYEFLNPVEGKLGPDKLKPMSIFSQSLGRIIMILICILLFYLAISKNFENPHGVSFDKPIYLILPWSINFFKTLKILSKSFQLLSFLLCS